MSCKDWDTCVLEDYKRTLDIIKSQADELTCLRVENKRMRRMLGVENE